MGLVLGNRSVIVVSLVIGCRERGRGYYLLCTETFLGFLCVCGLGIIFEFKSVCDLVVRGSSVVTLAYE